MTTDREIELESQLQNALELLHRYQSSDTIRPAAEADTGDYTKDKLCAERESRLSMLELGQATRDSELSEVFRQLQDIKEAIGSIASAVAALPCNPKCDACPDEQPPAQLRSVKP